MTMKTQLVGENVVQRGNFIVIKVFPKKRDEKKRKISNEQPKLPPKRIRKRTI